MDRLGRGTHPQNQKSARPSRAECSLPLDATYHPETPGRPSFGAVP